MASPCCTVFTVPDAEESSLDTDASTTYCCDEVDFVDEKLRSGQWIESVSLVSSVLSTVATGQ